MSAKDIGSLSIGLVFLGTIIGAILGIPASYFMQSGYIRAFVSLGDYLSNYGEILNEESVEKTFLLGICIFAVLGLIVGIALQTKINKDKRR